MNVLKAAEELDLSDWWIGAGFLRNKIWDFMDGSNSKPSRDVDLVYFDINDILPESDWSHDNYMKKKYPFAQWEVRNQARMHYYNNFQPYISTSDGIAHWVETATCIAVRLNNGVSDYLFCYGTDDLFNLIARPIPVFRSKELVHIFNERVKDKKWQERWPHLQIIVEDIKQSV